jgi:ribosomal protein S6E (S10)
MDQPMRGMGRIYQPDWRDKKTGQKRVSPTFWIAYSVRGKLIRQSSHSTKESEARRQLKKRLGEVAPGKAVGPDIEKTTFEDIAAIIVNDYKANRSPIITTASGRHQPSARISQRLSVRGNQRR